MANRTSPRAIVTAVVARLEDEDGDVRRAALQVLGGQSNLPEAAVAAVAARLEDEAGNIRSAAAEVVLRTFHSTLLNGPFVGSLYKVLLRRSFNEQWSWYVEDGKSCA